MELCMRKNIQGGCDVGGNLVRNRGEFLLLPPLKEHVTILSASIFYHWNQSIHRLLGLIRPRQEKTCPFHPFRILRAGGPFIGPRE